MLVLVTYGVNVEGSEGKRRLRKAAKICQNFGIRVQKTVFECVVDSVKLLKLKSKLAVVIDTEKDAFAAITLGNAGRRKVLHVGAKPAFDVEDVLII